MIRLLAALTASLVLAPAALAQATPAPEKADKPEKADRPEKPAASDLDPKTAEAIKRAVEAAKDEIRDEVRAELQGAQSAAEFLGTVAEGPKLEFLELNGYMRTRGQLYDQLGLAAGTDAAGLPYFPETMFSPEKRSTIATANMRLRLEPILNVSENVRVKAQVDVLDNYVLGSSTSRANDSVFGSYPTPFYGSSRVLYTDDPGSDRPAISPKRAWGEVQTPAGLLSFGRMPSGWGLGILTNAGSGLDQDFGDTVDRIQFALPPVGTPVGPLTFIPMLDFDAEGALYPDQQWGGGVGQPFDVDSADDARTYGLKAARIDTEDELRRKLERGESSFNFGAYYAYRTQRNVFPDWVRDGYGADLDPGDEQFAHRLAYGHVLDGWARLVFPRWRFEFEGVAALGHVGNAFVIGTKTDGSYVVNSLGQVLIRQWGAVLQTEYKAIPNKVSLGLEIGAASGDDAPGFGNDTSRGVTGASSAAGEVTLEYQPYGSLDGPQFGEFAPLDGTGLKRRDRDVRNFRFNPAYRVDLVLWRTILGQVTDALYVKPSLHWDMVPGLTLDVAVVYSQAMESTSTPSAEESEVDVDGTDDPHFRIVDAGNKSLGVELDTQFTYTSADGFSAWFAYGVLQPLEGLGNDLSRGHTMQLGFAARF